jgi:hypothetical protein
MSTCSGTCQRCIARGLEFGLCPRNRAETLTLAILIPDFENSAAVDQENLPVARN